MKRKTLTNILAVALCVSTATSAYNKHAVLKQREQLHDQGERLIKLQCELECFVNPIEYDVAAAPLYDVNLSDELQQYTYEMCRYYNVDYDLALAVMWQESNFEPYIISSTDDYGLMQINACNHEYLYETLGIVDVLDPHSNIESGVYILSTLINKYEDNGKALMAYNMGPSGAAKHWAQGSYSSVYSESVLNKQEKLKEYIRE